jgi:hypothetical protein
MLPHPVLLMRLDPQAASWLGAANQHETGRAVLGEIGIRIRLVYLALNQYRGTGQAAPLMTDRRKFDPTACRRVPDVFL